MKLYKISWNNISNQYVLFDGPKDQDPSRFSDIYELASYFKRSEKYKDLKNRPIFFEVSSINDSDKDSLEEILKSLFNKVTISNKSYFKK